MVNNTLICDSARQRRRDARHHKQALSASQRSVKELTTAFETLSAKHAATQTCVQTLEIALAKKNKEIIWVQSEWKKAEKALLTSREELSSLRARLEIDNRDHASKFTALMCTANALKSENSRLLSENEVLSHKIKEFEHNLALERQRAHDAEKLNQNTFGQLRQQLAMQTTENAQLRSRLYRYCV